MEHLNHSSRYYSRDLLSQLLEQDHKCSQDSLLQHTLLVIA